MVKSISRFSIYWEFWGNMEYFGFVLYFISIWRVCQELRKGGIGNLRAHYIIWMRFCEKSFTEKWLLIWSNHLEKSFFADWKLEIVSIESVNSCNYISSVPNSELHDWFITWNKIYSQIIFCCYVVMFWCFHNILCVSRWGLGSSPTMLLNSSHLSASI